MCAASRRIPASASANQGPEKGDLSSFAGGGAGEAASRAERSDGGRHGRDVCGHRSGYLPTRFDTIYSLIRFGKSTPSQNRQLNISSSSSQLHILSSSSQQ